MLTFIENAGVRLCLERRGAGPKHVLFLHGWISARRMWYDVAQRLDPERFTMHLLDFRGCGLSDRPKSGHHLEGYASDVVAALNAIGEPAAIAAHSMGGRVAQLVACNGHEFIERMILLAPGSPAGARVSKRRMALAQDAFGSRARIEAFQRAAMSVRVEEDVMMRLVDDALVAQREVWFGDPGHRSIDFSDRLQSIAVPVLCLAGAKDPLAPPARVKSDVAGKIPGSLTVTLRNAGHNLPVETPGEVAGAVERFVENG